MISIIKRLLAVGWNALYKLLRELFLQWFRQEIRALISLVWMVALTLVVLLVVKSCL